MSTTRSAVLIFTLALSAALLLPPRAVAHCDTVDGPVVTAAKLALKTGEITPILRWIRPQDEAQIRAVFARTIKVRALNAEAQALADNYFFETLVRVHRTGEGEPYTGLKPAGTEVEPGIALADQALETGSADALVKQVTTEMTDNLRHRFAVVQEAGKHADQSVEAGRKYVAAYVDFIHYVERLHESMSATAGDAHHASPVAQLEPNH